MSVGRSPLRILTAIPPDIRPWDSKFSTSASTAPNLPLRSLKTMARENLSILAPFGTLRGKGPAADCRENLPDALMGGAFCIPIQYSNLASYLQIERLQ